MNNNLDGDKIGFYDGIIIIIIDDDTENSPRVKKIINTANGLPDDKFISLNDCLEIIGYNGDGVVTVIFEEPLSGKIYEYGNHNPCGWEEHGVTKGYA